MARSPLPERESQICRRLKTWRELRKIRRKDFADALEMRPESYANYEYTRAPLTYGLAVRILGAFGINARWLATGEGPDGIPVSIPTPQQLGVSPRLLFSAVYDQRLSADVARKTVAVMKSHVYQHGSFEVKGRHMVDGRGRVLLEEYLVRAVKHWIAEVPDDQINAFVNDLHEWGGNLFESYRCDPHEVVEARKLKIEAARLFYEHRRKELGISPEV